MLHELSLDYEMRPIGSRTGETQTEEFTRLNPRQKIPVLVDGDLVLAESAAIVTYLADNYGQGRTLVPEPRTSERALYDQWCFFVAMELDAHTLYVLRKHRDLSALYGEAEAANAAAIEGFAKQVQVAARELSDGESYLVGESFTGADILLVSCLDWAVVYGLQIGDRLEAYRQRMHQREAYRTAFEDNFRSRPEIAPQVS